MYNAQRRYPSKMWGNGGGGGGYYGGGYPKVYKYLYSFAQPSSAQLEITHDQEHKLTVRLRKNARSYIGLTESEWFDIVYNVSNINKRVLECSKIVRKPGAMQIVLCPDDAMGILESSARSKKLMIEDYGDGGAVASPRARKGRTRKQKAVQPPSETFMNSSDSSDEEEEEEDEEEAATTTTASSSPAAGATDVGRPKRKFAKKK